jgi:hypothetical protein
MMNDVQFEPMHSYIGTKKVYATPMTRGDYNHYRGLQIPENEDPSEQGYLVEYQDGGKPCDSRHAGYISWSPACVFKYAYRQNGSLSFGDALKELKEGERIARSAWNDLQWLTVSNIGTAEVKADNFWSQHNAAFARDNGGTATVMPCITIKNVQDQIQMGWVPSQGDLFANDWVVLD